MRFLSVALLLGATGCAQIFGLDTTSGPADALPPELVTVQMQKVSLGATVVKSPLNLTGQTSTFYAADFTSVPGSLVAMDTFGAPIPSGNAAALFTLPDVPTPLQRLWSTPSRNQRGNFLVAEHPNPEDPPATAAIRLMISMTSPYNGSQTFKVQAIGAWAERGLVAADLPDPIANSMTINSPTPLQYASFTRMSANPIRRIIQTDFVLFLRYIGNQLTGVYQHQFEQSDATETITGTLTDVAANVTMDMTVTPTEYATRYSAVNPAVGVPSMSWSVNAAPGHSLASNAGTRLNSGTVAMIDPKITASFGNPFQSLDWKSVMHFSTSATRPYAPPTATNSLTLVAAMGTLLEANATPSTLNLPAGLPITIRANLTPLTSDGMMVALDLTKPVEIDAIVDRPGGSFYTLTVYEVVLEGTTASAKYVVDAVTTGMPSFKLPQELFAVGKSYYFNFRTNQGGYPMAATGDLQTTSLPHSSSSLDSGVFTVMAQ